MNFPVTGSLLIGLTGGIASGKSTVLQHLRQAGYSVIDADKLGHKVLEQGNPGYNKVVKCFGNEISLNIEHMVRLLEVICYLVVLFFGFIKIFCRYTAPHWRKI